jgi:flagellar protein FlgJ
MEEWRIQSDIRIEHRTSPAKRDKRLKEACKAFEAIFTYEVLKSMRRTVEKCDLFHGGQGEEVYESLLDQELSKKMAGDGPGSLAEQLYHQLKRYEGTQTGVGRKPDEAQILVSHSKAFAKKSL